MKRKLVLLSILTMILTGCNNTVSEPIVTYAPYIPIGSKLASAFNTTIYMTTYDKKENDRLTKVLNSEIVKLHKENDRHNNFDDVVGLADINANYDKGAIKISESLYNVIDTSIKMCKLTEGYFNPVIGSLVDLWEDKFTPYCLENVDPDVTAINNALTTIPSYQNIENIIELDKDNLTVKFNAIEGALVTPQISLSAIAKGYAMEVVATSFSKQPAMISGGSSSIITNGSNPVRESGQWNIGIKNPGISGINSQTYAILPLDNHQCLSTSGDYESCFLNQDNIRRHHILNPYTGYSENYYRSITVYSDKRADVLDALTTALFNCPDDTKFKEIIHNVEEYFDMDIEAIYITNTTCKATPNTLSKLTFHKDVTSTSEL